MKLIPTILCGGAGSRLWPVSRELHPKPFIRLAGGQSLLQKAWLRGAVLPDVAETLTVTNRELFFKTEDEYREVATIPSNQDLTNRFILEPFGRNTAPPRCKPLLCNWPHKANWLPSASSPTRPKPATATSKPTLIPLAERGGEAGYACLKAEGHVASHHASLAAKGFSRNDRRFGSGLPCLG